MTRCREFERQKILAAAKNDRGQLTVIECHKMATKVDRQINRYPNRLLQDLHGAERVPECDGHDQVEVDTRPMENTGRRTETE